MQAMTTTKQGHDLATVQGNPYLAALATWLQGKPDNTRRSYQRGIRDLFETTGADSPALITPLDVAGWKESMKARGLSDSTIAQRLSAVSSYYRYMQRPGPDGTPLCKYNPVDGVGRDDLQVSPYDRARPISPEAFKAIMAEIDVDTIAGARDRALFTFYALCARRRSEVIGLRGRDLRTDGGKMLYRVRLKGGAAKWKELPPPAWHAIKTYLVKAGRTLSDDSPVFTATTDVGKHLLAWRGQPEPDGETPLSGDAVSQALKRYARKTGLDPRAVSVHSLRHLGAETFARATNGDVRQTQLFLDHAQLNTTAIYLQQLTGEEHRHWQAMANELGVS